MSEGGLSQSVKDLAVLMGLGVKQDAQSVSTAQALLQNQQTYDEMKRNGLRNGRVIDAFWKSQCGESYEPPDEEMGNNFVNCSITSDAAVRQLAAILGEGDPQSPPDSGGPGSPTNPLPTPKPWWRWLIGWLLTAALIAAIIWLTLQWFGGDRTAYELIAEPYRPGE